MREFPEHGDERSVPRLDSWNQWLQSLNQLNRELAREHAAIIEIAARTPDPIPIPISDFRF